MKQIIKQELKLLTDIGDIDNITTELYYSELNYNNADQTSNQRVYSYEEIKTMIEQEFFKKQTKNRGIKK